MSTPTSPPRRVVSLACSNTEIVCALGCGDLLVGVDDHSDHPTEVIGSLPRVGPDLDIDVDRVAALEPDLVLATLTVPGHEKVVERLEAAGLPYVAPEPVSLEDVYRDVRDIAGLLGVPERGEALVAEMRAAIEGVGAEGAEGGAEGAARRRPSILVQWWPKPVIAPGRRSWVHDLLEHVGARHPLDAEEVKSRPLDDAEVAASAPDAIVLSWCGVDPAKYRPDVVYRNEAFAAVPAVTGGRVVCIPEAWLGRPGPRLVEGARALRAVVRAVRMSALSRET